MVFRGYERRKPGAQFWTASRYRKCQLAAPSVGAGEAIVDILAQSQIEVPIAGLNLVFDIERQLLHISVAKVCVISATARNVVGSQDGKIVGILAGRSAGALGWIRIAGQG